MKRFSKKIIAVALCLMLTAVCVPFSAFASSGNAKITIGTVSDTHVIASSLLGSDLTNFLADNRGDTKQFEYTEKLLQNALGALAEHAKANGMKYVIMSGDLSKDGELTSHKRIAEILKNFEAETGLKVYVINGNHDINNSNAASYVTNTRVADGSEVTSPEQFREIYADFGYNQAYHTYTPPTGKKQGMLSYSVKLDGNYRLIAIDTCCYSADATKDGTTEHETRGMISDELMTWVLEEIADAKKNGETVIGLCHHGIVAHHDLENNVIKAFVVDDWEDAASKLANAGMHYVFTGHQHCNDIASYVSSDGETIFDCETDSLASYPHDFKEVVFDNTDSSGKISATYSTYPVDCVKKMTALDGSTIDDFAKFSFRKVFLNGADGDIAPFFDSIMNEFVVGFIKNINTKYNLGLSEEQISKICKDFVARLKVLKVSDIPSTKFKDSLGFYDTDYGTMTSAICEAWSYVSAGDEYIGDDEFMKDVINQCKNGDIGIRLVNTLLQSIYEGAGGNPEVSKFVNSAYSSWSSIYSSIKDSLAGMNIDTSKITDLLGSLGSGTGALDTSALSGVTGSLPIDTSTLQGLLGKIDLSALGDGASSSSMPSIDKDTLEAFLKNPTVVGNLLAYALESFCIDTNPGEKQDNFYTHSYTGKIDTSNSSTSTPASTKTVSTVIPGGTNPSTGTYAAVPQPKKPSAVELLIALPVCALALITTALIRKRREEA